MENARQGAISANQNKLTPAQLLARQLSGNVVEVTNHKPKIIKKYKLAKYSSYTTSVVSTDEPLFDASPPIVQFTDYGSLSTQDKILKLRNKDRYARRVKIVPTASSFFQVLPNKTACKNDIIKSENDDKFCGSKVAPGMDISFTVRFSPDAKIDYTFDLVVMTEREQFLVPIVAIGKKPMVDFPDTLDFGKCLVKYQSEKPVVVRNVGEKTVRWYLQLPHPFYVNKKEGLLEKGCNEQIIVSFLPQERKEYLLEAEFTYENLKSYVVCRGKAEDGEVSLSKITIALDDAYAGLRTHQTLKIINKTNVKVDFEWRAFATEKEEQEKKNKLLSQLKQDEAEENVLLKEVATCDLSDNDYGIDEDNESYEQERCEHTAIVTKQKRNISLLARKYNNMRKAIEEDLLLFQDKIFKIEPLSGQVWPNSTHTVTVSFTPSAALKYSCTAFCNVSCKEDRLVLNLTGQGIGPKAVIIPKTT